MSCLTERPEKLKRVRDLVPTGAVLGHQPSLSRADAQRELRIGEPGEGCRAVAAQRRRRASQIALPSIPLAPLKRSNCASSRSTAPDGREFRRAPGGIDLA